MAINKIPKQLREKIEAINEYASILVKGLNNSYELISVKTENDKFLRYVHEVLYSNSLLKRKISIRYLPYDVNGNTSDIITISLTKEPYSGQQDYLDLQIYLTKENPSFSLDTFKIGSYVGTTVEKVSKLFEVLQENIEAYLMEVIQGKDWIEGYYPQWNK